MTFHKVIVPISQFLTKVKISTTIIYSYSNIHINNINVLYYDRVDVSEGIHIKIQINQKSSIFIAIGILQRKGLSFNCMYAMCLMIH